MATSVRTRPAEQRLRRAILREAAATAPGAITVAQLCADAGVTRDTFYRYAESPTALLAAVLDEELQPLADLAGDLAGTEPLSRAAWVDFNRAWLQHLSEHEQVYRHAAETHLPHELRSVLERRIVDALLIVARAHPEIVPSIAAEHDWHDRHDRHDLELLATYGTAGAIGVVEATLRSSEPFDVDRMIRVIQAAAADWWFGPRTAAGDA